MDIEQTATKAKCREVKASFGVWDTLSKFLDPQECLTNQALDQFCYNIAVSRVQTRLDVEPPIFITWPFGTRFKDTIFKYNHRGEISTVLVEQDLQNWLTV